MVVISHSKVSREDTVCPFCGQPLLNTKAVAHLQHQRLAYEAQLRQQAEVEAQSQAEARIQAAEKALRADAAKHLAQASKKERDRLELQFSRREKQLDLTLTKLQEQNSELSRRVEKLSAGDRGEFNEAEIVVSLTWAFPDDDIKQTRRGQRGADIFQKVRFRTDGDLTEAGLIIYECKDVLHWNNSFITQMKAEAKLHATPYAILVSRCFPPGLKSLAVVDDIIVVDPARVVPLAQVMRRMVVESYRKGVIAASQAEKTAELFRYISSTEFGQAFDTLSEDAAALEGLLTRERQSHQKMWAERERRYQNVGETVINVDQRFKSILESNAKKGTVRLLSPERVTA